MTANRYSGAGQLLSALTISSLADLGYKVNEGLAEDKGRKIYTPLNASRGFNDTQPHSKATARVQKALSCGTRRLEDKTLRRMINQALRRQGRAEIDISSDPLVALRTSDVETAKIYDTAILIVGLLMAHLICLL